MKWWIDEPLRLVQTNLREIDADLDPKRVVSDVVELGGNVLLFNVGGIQANYPTQLRYHFRNPCLQEDLVEAVLEQCKAAGVRFIARFDFSKANVNYYLEHPEWFYRSLEGEAIDYNGQVHTCVNGYYQREYSLEILREALTLYRFDGVFFNMFGYQTRDYSGNYHGICQCDNCKQAFFEFAGLDLPTVEDMSQPGFRKYRSFQRITVKKMLDRIADLVKGHGENIAVCTYDTYRVDIVRSESNSAVDRPLPHFLYNGSDNTRLVTASYQDKTPSNSAVHFVDIPYRHIGVSKHLTQLRLAQTIANGGGPDYYVIGTLGSQEDRTVEASVCKLFRFYVANESLYVGSRPAARLALLAHNRWSTEYQGIFRVLAEEHILFNVLEPDAIRENPDILSQYELVVIPGDVYLDNELADLYDRYVASGGKLLATQRVLLDSTDAMKAPVALRCLGVEEIVFTKNKMRGAYFEIPPRSELGAFEDLDLCFLDKMYHYVKLGAKASGLMKLIPPCMYGPPEKCYYETKVDSPGLVTSSYGDGLSAYFPWGIGELYNMHSWPGHRRILAAAIETVLGLECDVSTNAPDQVEIVLLTQGGKWMEAKKHWLLQLINASGHSGTAYHEPIPCRDIRVSIPVPREPLSVSLMGTNEGLDYTMHEGRLEVIVPRLELLAGVVIKWDED